MAWELVWPGWPGLLQEQIFFFLHVDGHPKEEHVKTGPYYVECISDDCLQSGWEVGTPALFRRRGSPVGTLHVAHGTWHVPPRKPCRDAPAGIFVRVRAPQAGRTLEPFGALYPMSVATNREIAGLAQPFLRNITATHLEHGGYARQTGRSQWQPSELGGECCARPGIHGISAAAFGSALSSAIFSVPFCSRYWWCGEQMATSSRNNDNVLDQNGKCIYVMLLMNIFADQCIITSR